MSDDNDNGSPSDSGDEQRFRFVAVEPDPAKTSEEIVKENYQPVVHKYGVPIPVVDEELFESDIEHNPSSEKLSIADTYGQNPLAVMEQMQGMDDKAFFEKLRALENAEKIEVVKHQGVVTGFVVMADNVARLSALRLDATLRGWNKHNINVEHNHEVGDKLENAIRNERAAREKYDLKDPNIIDAESSEPAGDTGRDA